MLPKVQARLWIVLAAAGLSVAIFLVDTVTHPDVVVAALYLAVVLLAARVFQPRGIVLVSVACGVLTCLSALLTFSRGISLIGVSNTLVSLTVIGLTSALTLQSKSAESSLRRQARLLDLTHDGIFIRDLEGKIRTWNRGAEELYGWTAKEAIGAVAQQLLRTVFPLPWERIEAELVMAERDNCALGVNQMQQGIHRRAEPPGLQLGHDPFAGLDIDHPGIDIPALVEPAVQDGGKFRDGLRLTK